MKLPAWVVCLVGLTLTAPVSARDWTTFETVAVPIDDLVDLAVDSHIGCGVRQDGTVTCWTLRRKRRGKRAAAPIRFPNVDDARQVAVAHTTVCVLRGTAADSRVQCAKLWSERGEFSSPTLVPGLEAPSAIAGDNRRFCAIEAGGRIACFDPAQPSQLERPPNLTRAVAVAPAPSHACALRDDGSVHCWGSNAYGALGTQRNTVGPVRVGGIDDAVAIAAGPRSSCAVERDGDVLCWGSGAPSGPQHGDIVRVPFDAPATAVVSLEARTCALLDEARIECTGEHPLDVTRLTPVRDFDMSRYLTCAVDDDGEPRCVGTVINTFRKKETAPPAPTKARWIGATVSSRLGLGGGTRIAPLEHSERLFEMSLRSDVLFGDGPFEKGGSALGLTLDLRTADFNTWEAGLGPMLTAGGKGERISGIAGGLGYAKRPGNRSGAFAFATASLGYREALKKRKTDRLRWSYGFSMALYLSARWGLDDARTREITAGVEMEAFMLPAVVALAGGGIYALITGEKNPVLSK